MYSTTTYRGLKLDDFQAEAITYLNEGKSVIVSAPTGIGKTLVADYLIEKTINENKCVIYTAPTKALSNQKYRQFSRYFGEEKVGILTGDIVINRSAPLLIMTTEVFRNMLLSDEESLEYIRYVIFDEIHYISDLERGAVWEECLLLKPKSIGFLGLSATIPNVDELAEWVSTINGEKVKIVKETRRAVPIEHKYFLPVKIQGINSIAPFKEASEWYDRLILTENVKVRSDNVHIELIQQLGEENLPCLYFVFNRNECFNKAYQLHKIRDRQSNDAISKIDEIVFSTLKLHGINQEEIIRFQKYIDMFYKGVGLHHAGLPPIMKIIVEKLYEAGLLKILYCTETFAIGVNLPVKTVCFDSYMKFDGREFRKLKQQEYFQMAGRAGRRGIDEHGTAITVLYPENLTYEGVPEWDETKIEKLSSSFNLTYNSVLHLFENIDGILRDEIINNNFAVYLAKKNEKEFQKKIHACKQEIIKAKKNICKYIMQEECPLQYNIIAKKWDKKITKARENKAEMKLEWKNKKEELKMKQRPCNTQKVKKCEKTLPEFKKKLAYIEQLQHELKIYRQGTPSIYFNENFEKKKKILADMGYININGQTTGPRGETLKNLYFQELLVTELIYSDFLMKHDKHVINAILSGVDFKSRKNDKVDIPSNERATNAALRDVKQIVEYISSRESRWLDEQIVQFDGLPCELIYRLSVGMSVREVMKYTTLSDGDIVNVARRTLNLLRQIREVVKDNRILAEKIDECIMCLDNKMIKVIA